MITAADDGESNEAKHLITAADDGESNEAKHLITVADDGERYSCVRRPLGLNKSEFADAFVKVVIHFARQTMEA